MDILFLIFIILSGLLLIILVMLQDEGGEGLGGIFGGGSNTAFGSRSGNVLTRITAVLATVFIVSTLGLAYLKRTPRESEAILDYAREQKYKDSDDQLWYVTTEDETTTTTDDTQVEPEDEANLTEGNQQPEESTDQGQ
ncbi:MAG: preprotein translocase subunit SecG [Spirochaetales bacterium]|nr:preprotein translocase subunit SecG [Spirochaetales bacterium]